MEKKTLLLLALPLLAASALLSRTTAFAQDNGSSIQSPAGFVASVAVSSGGDPYILPAPGAFKSLSSAEGAQTISYYLSKPAMVRVRIGLAGDAEAVVRTLSDWENRPAGLNQATWDGRDASGNKVDPKACSINIQAKTGEALPEFITDLYAETATPPKRHNRHNPAVCHELKIAIASPGVAETVSGLHLFQVDLDPSSLGYGDQVGNGLRVYLDYQPHPVKEVFLTGARSFVWEWDTTGIPNGIHTILVNVCDHNDHVGTASVRISVQN